MVLRTGGGAGYGGTIQLTNPDIARNPIEKGDAANILLRQSLGIVRERLLSDGLGERIRIQNYTTHPERCRVTLRVDADFADIFEVRGVVREKRGERLPDVCEEDRVVFSYLGLDDRLRRTELRFSEVPRILPADLPAAEMEQRLKARQEVRSRAGSDDVAPGNMLLLFDWLLPPGAVQRMDVRVTSEVIDSPGRPDAPRRTIIGPRHLPAEEAEAAHRAWHSSSATVSTTHHMADRALRRG